jgi:phage portal protein BeeE
LANAIKPGKTIVHNQKVESQIVSLEPRIQQLVEAKRELDSEVLGAYEVPRFLLNREREVNRATAEKQFESFVYGPVEHDRRWIKRALEAQWYDPLTRSLLKLRSDELMPVRVVHRWRPIQPADFYALLDSTSRALQAGMIDRKKGYEIMHDGLSTSFDPREIE